MLGDAGVGKSSITLSFKLGSEIEQNTEATIGFDLWTKVVELDGNRVKTLVYDTSGQEVFHSIWKSYVRQGDGIIIVYDVTDSKSFESVNYWLEVITDIRDDKPSIVIVGNKTDLISQRAITTERGQAFAQENGAMFIETSTKNFMSIEHAFMIAIKQIYCKKIEEEATKVVNQNKIKLDKQVKTRSRKSIIDLFKCW